MTIIGKATTYTFGTAGSDLLTAQYTLGDLIDGLGGNDTIYGLDGGDILKGGAGRDTLHGLGGNDTLDGGADNDSLFGGSGDDILQPGLGNDIVDGGDGFDTVDYSSSGITKAVTIDLRLSTQQNTRGAGLDTIINVENVTGSAYNDTITGNAFGNDLSGGAGADTIRGGDGLDVIRDGKGADSIYGEAFNDTVRADTTSADRDLYDGGIGIDTINYIDSAIGVTVNLGISATAQNTGAGLDTIRNFEQIQGSRFNDVLTGDAGDNWINGDTGSDTIKGGDGNDRLFAGNAEVLGGTNTLDGGNGDDILKGGTGNDTLLGGAGNDRFQTGTGIDTVWGGAGADTFALGVTPSDHVTIMDFETADTLYLFNFALRGLTSVGDGAFTANGVNSELRITATTGGQLLEVDANADGLADVSIAVQGAPVVWNNDPLLSDITYGSFLTF